MGNTLDGYCYRLKKNDPDLVELCCNDESLEPIGDEGAMDFASALAINTTLKTLDLGCMDIGDDGAMSLAHALVLNKTLTLLRVHRNKISEEGAGRLIAALRHNHHITALYIAMNVVRDDDLKDEIQKLVKINKEAGPDEAARLKSEMYSPGWIAEGAELRRNAEEELCCEEDMESMSADTRESMPLVCLSSYASLSRGHEKSD